jgi:hypothetical protein
LDARQVAGAHGHVKIGKDKQRGQPGGDHGERRP